jgi:hypothetical protein
MEGFKDPMQEIIGRMATQMAEAKDAMLKKAIAKHLGVEVLAPEHLKEVEMVKMGREQEWLLHQGKSFGYLNTVMEYPSAITDPIKVSVYPTLTFIECNSERVDQMISDHKYKELQARMAEEMKQAKLWGAAIEAINPILHDDSISKQDEPIAIVKRLLELGFRLEMVGSE